MTCYQFNRLNPKIQLEYIYDHCQLLDFMMQSGPSFSDAICLYHNGTMFMEVCFDGLQGDRVKEIRSYSSIQQLRRWYEPISLTSLFQNTPKS